MSISTVLLDGVRRAATYAAMLFSLNAPQPADAGSLPAAAAELVLDGSIAATGLTLAAHHVDARIAGDRASVRTLLLLRNDTEQSISAQYLLPHPARIARGEPGALRGRGGLDELCGDGDLPPGAAELAEAAAGRPLRPRDVLVVAPGEQVSVEVEREVPVAASGDVHRLHLPLPLDPAAPWVPRFTADVLVEAERPIRRLVSPSHPVLVDGVGERTALLSVADGQVHRQALLTVEFELDPAAQGAAAPAGAVANR
jgi:hypothetical protein